MPPRSYTCSFCSGQYLSIDSLSIHTTRCRMYNNSSGVRQKCPFCRGSVNPGELLGHTANCQGLNKPADFPDSCESVDLISCRHCSRTFLPDRIEKHELACGRRAASPRMSPSYDSSYHRLSDFIESSSVEAGLLRPSSRLSTGRAGSPTSPMRITSWREKSGYIQDLMANSRLSDRAMSPMRQSSRQSSNSPSHRPSTLRDVQNDSPIPHQLDNFNIRGSPTQSSPSHTSKPYGFGSSSPRFSPPLLKYNNEMEESNFSSLNNPLVSSPLMTRRV